MKINLKKPIEPKKPTAPNPPEKFLPENNFKDISLRLYEEYDLQSLQEILPDGVHLNDVSFYITNCDSNRFDEFGIDISFKFSHKIENSNFKYQYDQYLVDLESYKSSMKDYKLQLKQYKKELKEYLIKANELEIVELEQKLLKLKSGKSSCNVQ